MIPHWDAEAGNPIHQFVPESERPFQKSTSDFFEASTTGQGRTREERLLNLSRQRTPLCLAGAMSLRKREHSPESMIRKRAGFVNPVVVPDAFHEKVKTAIDNKYAYNMATRSKELLPREWVPPREPEFRKEAEIEPGMHDFVLRPKALPLENKHGLSVFNSKPKYIDEKRRANEEKSTHSKSSWLLTSHKTGKSTTSSSPRRSLWPSISLMPTTKLQDPRKPPHSSWPRTNGNPPTWSWQGP